MSKKGFTLAELLIALSILGVIATYSIPKILYSSQNNRNNAITKEAIGMVSAAFEQAQMAGTVTTGTKASDLAIYMNYVSTTTNPIDNAQTLTTEFCTGTHTCIKLHNGAVLMMENQASFGGNGTTNAVPFALEIPMEV